MERFEIEVDGFRGSFGVAMGPIFGGYCIVGPPEALTHFNAVFEVLLTAFPEVREAYEDGADHDPLIILATPSDHADSFGWDVQRVTFEDAFEFGRAIATDDVIRALRRAEILLPNG